MRYYPINEEADHTAWSMNHMGTLNSDEIDYMREVDQAYDIAEETAERCPDQRDAAIELADSFAQRLADWFNKKYRATQRTVPCVMRRADACNGLVRASACLYLCGRYRTVLLRNALIYRRPRSCRRGGIHGRLPSVVPRLRHALAFHARIQRGHCPLRRTVPLCNPALLRTAKILRTKTQAECHGLHVDDVMPDPLSRTLTRSIGWCYHPHPNEGDDRDGPALERLHR